MGSHEWDAQPELLDVARGNLQRWLTTSDAGVLRERLRGLSASEDRKNALQQVLHRVDQAAESERR
jgi:hypothetical protein